MLRLLTRVVQIGLITLFVAWSTIGSWWQASPGQLIVTFGHWLTKDAAGFFTLCLVLIGGGQFLLFWWQLRLIRESQLNAKQAADAATAGAKAAEVNAQAVIDAESAKLYVVHLESNISDIFRRAKPPNATSSPTETDIFNPPFVEYRLRNYGKSPAVIRTVHHGFSLTNIRELGPNFDVGSLSNAENLPLHRNTWEDWNKAMEIIGIGEQTMPIRCEYSGPLYPDPFTFDDAKSLIRDTLLTFYGGATFLDTFGRKHHLRWEFFAYAGTERWELIDHREDPSQ
jgi:hypothetical protein